MNNSPTIYRKIPLLGAVLAGGLASSCCIGPFTFIILGLGSSSAFMIFEPFHPLFVIITIGLLVWVGWQHWHTRKTCTLQGSTTPKPILLCFLGSIAIFLHYYPTLFSKAVKYG